MSAFEALKRKIFEKRWGVVCFDSDTLEKFEYCEINTLLDSYVKGLGFHDIGAAWREVDLASAKKILMRILYKDLAYDQELMPLADAQTLADQVIDLCGSNASFYTNGDYDLEENKQSVEWTPITNATFDTGVIFVGESQIGLLWVEDED